MNRLQFVCILEIWSDILTIDYSKVAETLIFWSFSWISFKNKHNSLVKKVILELNEKICKTMKNTIRNEIILRHTGWIDIISY